MSLTRSLHGNTRPFHSSSCSYKDQHSKWQEYQPWTDIEPYGFVSLNKRALAAEMKLSIKGSRAWDASWVMVKIYGRSDPITNYMREVRQILRRWRLASS